MIIGELPVTAPGAESGLAVLPKISLDVPSTVDMSSRPPEPPVVEGSASIGQPDVSVDVPCFDLPKTDVPAADVPKVGGTAGKLSSVDTTVDIPAKAPGVEGEIKCADVPAVEVGINVPDKPLVDAPVATDLTAKLPDLPATEAEIEAPKVPTGVDVTTDVPSVGMSSDVKVTAPDVTVEGKVCSYVSFCYPIF